MNQQNVMVMAKDSVGKSVMATYPQTIQYGPYEYAVPFEHEGTTYWVKTTLAVGLLKDTVRNKAFDPHAVRADWLAKLQREQEAREAQEAQDEIEE